MLKRDYPTQYCPVASTLEVIGERWTLLIVRDVFLGIRRFEDIQRDLGVARNVLQVRLERLVEEGILVKRPYQERPAALRVPADREGRRPVAGAGRDAPVGRPPRPRGGERPMILQHRDCGGELDDRRRCLACGADVTVTEAVAVRTGRTPAPRRDAGPRYRTETPGAPAPRHRARRRRRRYRASP